MVSENDFVRVECVLSQVEVSLMAEITTALDNRRDDLLQLMRKRIKEFDVEKRVRELTDQRLDKEIDQMVRRNISLVGLAFNETQKLEQEVKMFIEMRVLEILQSKRNR